MMSAPFLQHPALTTGQRRYLCSIANVYSTESMRRLMKQHYLDVLRTSVWPGQTPTWRWRSEDHQHRENSRFTNDAEKDVKTRTKAQGQRKSSITANSEVIFPKNTFGKAIHALSRIGEELWLDPMVKGLALRSVNAAHSAYACFLFSPLFFQHYSLGSEQGNETIKCKLIMKSVLPLFRCLTSIERNVERCQISISTPTDRVVIQFFCRHGIIKTHDLCFQESEALQAVFASHLCPNVLKAPARLLGDIVMHFPVSQEEITLSVTPLKVSLRNYYEREDDHMKFMYTEMSLHPDEFDYFQVGADSGITFCLKELRGFLSFAESHSLPVSIHFGAAGKPVCFSVEDMVLEATVVLATLVVSENGGPSQPTGSPAPATTRCADAAAPCVGLYEVPAAMELIPSSQGSPMIDPPTLMQLLPQNYDPDGLVAPDEACDTTNTTPASTTFTVLTGWVELRGAKEFQVFNLNFYWDVCPECIMSHRMRLHQKSEEDKQGGEDHLVRPVSSGLICSLLFRALSSEEEDGGCAAGLPVLAGYSDIEEDVEDPAGNHSL